MAKFKVGDRARFVARHPNASRSMLPIGAEVIVIDKNILALRKDGSIEMVDYYVLCEKYASGVNEWQLEPIIDLGSWDELQKTINWNPTKEISHHD